MKRFLVARTIAIATPAAATIDGHVSRDYEQEDISSLPGALAQEQPECHQLVALQAETERRLPAPTAHG